MGDSRLSWRKVTAIALLCGVAGPPAALGDSVNSPNFTLHVDTNRAVGPGAGNVPVAINAITIAELNPAEYSSGPGKALRLRVRPGYVFDPSSPVSVRSATVGFNGAAVNTDALLAPSGLLGEELVFLLTSGTSPTVQDIIRISGIKLKIGSAAGAAGPAQTTLSLTTTDAGGVFTDQGIAAATIQTGAPDHLAFATEPGTVQAGASLLPVVRVADFGGNLVSTSDRTIVLSLQENPGAATLEGVATRSTVGGRAEWQDADALRIAVAADGYTLRATHDGPALQSSDTADSRPFAITAGPPGRLVFSTQPVTTAADDTLLVAVTALDELDNPNTSDVVSVTLDLAENPTLAPLLGATLTKETVNGVATWDVADQLRITTAGEGFRLSASGVGAPVESDPFDIEPGGAIALRYLQQPTNVTEGEVVEPTVRVEAIDLFGNRVTAFEGPVTASLVEAPCDDALSGSEATAEAGVASFPDLVVATACEDDVLKAASPGLAWAGSDPFDVAVAADARPIAATLVQLKPDKVVKLVAKGAFALPDPVDDDPTKDGGSLTVVGTTGEFVQELPASGWRKLGKKRDGRKGFRFTSAACPQVVVKPALVKAICRGDTGTLAVPEPGPVEVVLRVGGRTARYCARCGGTTKGDPTIVFKRKACAAPEACR